jgi:ABC-2 type transport system permease protein
VQLLLNGKTSNSSQLAASYISQIIIGYQNIKIPLTIRNFYNPNLENNFFIIPSLVALITTIGVMIITALSIAREKENGTLEQILVSPLTVEQIFLGKAIPALLVAFMQATIVLLVGIFAYKIPFQGSFGLLYGSMFLYGLSLIGFGLLISSICGNQQQAFIGTFIFIMPCMLLSGFVAPVENITLILQDFALLNPIYHFMEIVKFIYVKGAGFESIKSHLLYLIIIAILTNLTALFYFKKLN